MATAYWPSSLRSGIGWLLHGKRAFGPLVAELTCGRTWSGSGQQRLDVPDPPSPWASRLIGPLSGIQRHALWIGIATFRDCWQH